MYILVDKLPTCPRECKFHSNESDVFNGCKLDIGNHLECRIGSDGFKCPNLMEFKATAREPMREYGPHVCKIIPVELDRR